MINIKRFTILLICLFFAFSPIIENVDFSYADNEVPWSTAINNSHVCAALKAYAMAEYKLSQTFNFGANDPITSSIIGFSYSQWASLAASKGIDMNQLQNSIKYRVANNGTLQFLYSGSFIQDYNTLVQAYLDKYNLNGNNFPLQTNVFNGEIFKDADDITAYVYKVTDTKSSDFNLNDYVADAIYQVGSYYKYDSTDLYNLYINNETPTFNLTTNITTTLNLYEPTSNTVWSIHNNQLRNCYKFTPGTLYNNSTILNSAIGFPIIFRSDTSPDKLWFGILCHGFGKRVSDQKEVYCGVINGIIMINNPNTFNAIVDASKYGANAARTAVGKNAAISVGVQGGQNAQDAIDNYLKDNEPEEPELDPDVPTDDEPDFPDPEDPEQPDNPNVNVGFPIGGIFANGQFSFQMPDLNNLPNTPHSIPNSWTISGLIHKFPFCIPLDIYAIIDLCDATPQAPRIQGTVDLGAFNYDLDINLSEFDPVMVYVRNFFLMLFCFGLCFITKEILF